MDKERVEEKKTETPKPRILNYGDRAEKQKRKDDSLFQKIRLVRLFLFPGKRTALANNSIFDGKRSD